MEKIKNILGLGVYNKHIVDRFTMAFIKALNRMANKLMSSAENLGEEEKEMSPLKKRKEEVLDKGEDQAYGEVLRLLARLRPEYKKYLPKRRKGSWPIPDLLKRKIRLAAWVGTGNEIPFGELREVLVKKLLKEKGYTYRRKKKEMGWYLGDQFVGKNLIEALEHLESFKAVDRNRLAISF